MSDRIQEGVYFRSGERPAPCWRLLLLDVSPGAAPADVREALGRVMRMLAALRAGKVRELRGQPAAGVRATRDTFDGPGGARRLRPLAVRPTTRR